MLQMKTAPFEDLGFAKVDHHRALRQGAAEVIYGSGKTPDQIVKIAESLLSQGAKTVLVTRISAETAREIEKQIALQYFDTARIGIVGSMPAPITAGQIVVATGGTSDMPVAEEAAITAEALGNRVVRLYDVGVAGLHRLLSNLEPLMSARVVIAIAGMEGALASGDRRAGGLPRHRGADQRRLRRVVRRRYGAALHAQLLRERSQRGQHRQRLWRGISRQHDQPYG